MQKTDELELISRAKINLTLEVLFRRFDGYHELLSVMQELELGDEIMLKNLTDSDQIELECSNEDLPRDEANLAVKAAALLQQEFSPQKGAFIRLVKNIPIAAGLGGGSSNAAAVLLGLNELWKLKLEKEILLKLAARIGSDVPFFIEGGTVLAEGRGEKLKPLHPFPCCSVLLASPSGTKLSAAEVYSSLNLDRIPEKTITGKFVRQLSKGNQVDRDRLGSLQKLMINHLEDAVFSLSPEVENLKKKLSKAGLPALVSGSGPTVFAVSEDRDALRQAADQLLEEEYTVILTGIQREKELEKSGDTP